MDYAVIVSAIVLGLSVLASLAKFLDWFMHSDPRTMVRTTRWMLLLLVLACALLVIVALARGQWALGMLGGAGLLAFGTLLNWRAVLASLRAAFGHLRPRPQPFDMEVWQDADDAEKVGRAAAVLEAYVKKTSVAALTDDRKSIASGMSRHEALRVLGLPADADEAAIHAARLRLLRLVHPDNGGSAWLADQVRDASEALLSQTRQRRSVA